MREALIKARRYQHVVFPESVGGYGRAVNLAPHQPSGADGAGSEAEATGAGAPVETLSTEVESFLRWIFAQAGLNFRHYKPETLGRRMPACLRALRANSPAQARSIVQRNPQLARPALDAALIGVTGFFRDGPVFESLHRRTLPDIVNRWRSSGGVRPLRVWSAGCSDGAELYTVAMLLAELGTLTAGRVDLLGTDCRHDALERAAAGAFEPPAMKGVPPALLARYFNFDGERYRIHSSLRAATRWRRADVLASPEPGPWDLVLCRNLAIYLQPPMAAALWESLVSVVRRDGALVLGKAERPSAVAGLRSDGPCTYRRAGA